MCGGRSGGCGECVGVGVVVGVMVGVEGVVVGVGVGVEGVVSVGKSEGCVSLVCIVHKCLQQ